MVSSGEHGAQVARERAGEAIDVAALAGVTRMLLEVGRDVYVSALERPFLAASRAFFQCESGTCLAHAFNGVCLDCLSRRLLDKLEFCVASQCQPCSLPCAAHE